MDDHRHDAYFLFVFAVVVSGLFRRGKKKISVLMSMRKQRET